jgi:hypothetical protein
MAYVNNHRCEAFPVFRRVYAEDDLTLGVLSDGYLHKKGFYRPDRRPPVLAMLSTFNVRCFIDATTPSPASTEEFADGLRDRLPPSARDFAAVERKGVSRYGENGAVVFYSAVKSPLIAGEHTALTGDWSGKLNERESNSMRAPRIIWGEARRNPALIQKKLDEMLPQFILVEPVIVAAPEPVELIDNPHVYSTD